MSDENITAGEYLRRQFGRMDDRFDSIERKLDALLAMLPPVERHDQNLDIVLLRLLARVKALEERE